ncbi:hypothetical protein HRI_001573400 [Hibiscus trionum]|uniref:DCD domain-containing protein n=1 Tax=Hibiscus trionum TaxID=183268 RepID=A0A9W7LWX2_HIBTR|nr:hypothetical protein HRI_001573400 [Hibiscus trionum]
MEFEGRLKKKITGKFPDFGAIFMSNASTKEECFNRNLFGLPHSCADFVKGVKIGMILFLFEYEKRELHGVFKATSDGELNIVPCAYSSSRRIFPAQVRFTVLWHCLPLQEHEFQTAIRDNYFSTNKFNFGLSKYQVQRLLWLFDSRKIRLFQPNIVMENVWANHFTMARKKLKRGIDSVSHSNAEPLAYSGKSTVTKDESHVLDSGDSHIAFKESNNMHYNSSYCSEGPSSQSSLPFVASHITTSGQESGARADHAIQSQPILIGEELKELNTSGSHDIDLGDYIPLLPSDDSDSTDSRASPDPGGLVKYHPRLYEDTYQHVSVASPIAKLEENARGFKSPIANCQENNNSGYIRSHTPGRGLYSDASNNRGSVFSRLNFSSGIQDNEDDAKVDKSAPEIMEELQQMHDQWKKKVRRGTSFERQNGDGLNKRKSVFLRLSWTSETEIQDIGVPARSVERRDKHPWRVHSSSSNE